MKLVVVLGFSDGRVDGLHPVCAARLERAFVEAADADAVVLTGSARRLGTDSEAELMRQAWRGPATRLICESRARITAENAAHVAELVRELAVAEVVVVTSWWHRLRARLLFVLLLRGSGAGVRVVAVGRPWPPRLLLREAAAFALVPLQLGRARARAGGRPG